MSDKIKITKIDTVKLATKYGFKVYLTDKDYSYVIKKDKSIHINSNMRIYKQREYILSGILLLLEN